MSETMRAWPMPSEKVRGHHRDRLAVVYVRQSTLQQLVRHQESTRLQYGLVDRALGLGWPQAQVLVIDDDQGKSATTAAGRPGFQRLVAEVGLNHVGLVLGVEMSRLARSCRDWHQLLEICGLFGTLIGDLDGIYDPTDYNDRLLLGLKGTLSEAELHMLKQRMLAGKRAKAERGELGMAVPMGYARRPSGEVILDPDEQARATIALVFAQFERCGTINGVLQYLVRHQIQLPHRVRLGLRQGDLDWHRPNRTTLSNLLHHPIYAGAYAYGRRPTDPRRQQPGRPATGRRMAAPVDCAVLLQDHLPAPISVGHNSNATRPNWRPTKPPASARSARGRRCCRAWRSAAGAGCGWPPCIPTAAAGCVMTVAGWRWTMASRAASRWSAGCWMIG